VAHKFYMGASVRGPEGDWIDLPYRETRELASGEELLDLLRWTVPVDAAAGSYDITIAVWKGKSTDGKMLVDELDRETKDDQFLIETRSSAEGIVKAEIIDPIYWPEGTHRPGNMVDVGYTIKNTGTVAHKFYMGASVRGPEGDWIDLPYRETRELAPGEVLLDLLRWTVPVDASAGSYDITIAVWKGKSIDGKMLVDELDRETKDDQFRIESIPSGEDYCSVNVCSQECEHSNIQEAVDTANPGDIICIAEGTYIENIHIDKSLTIKGAGEGKTIVDGNHVGPVFTVGKNNPEANVMFFGMTMNNGSGDFTDNFEGSGEHDYLGGAIYNGESAFLTVENCTLSDNHADNGGAIFNSGSLILKNSSLLNNRCRAGGGIFNSRDRILILQESTISGNFASFIGGGIRNGGVLTIEDSIILDNIADSYGGGIFNGDGLVSIYEGSSIFNNIAHITGGGFYNNSGTVIFKDLDGKTIQGYLPNNDDYLHIFRGDLALPSNSPNNFFQV